MVGAGEEKSLEKRKGWRRKGAGEGNGLETNSGSCPNIDSRYGSVQLPVGAIRAIKRTAKCSEA